MCRVGETLWKLLASYCSWLPVAGGGRLWPRFVDQAENRRVAVSRWRLYGDCWRMRTSDHRCASVLHQFPGRRQMNHERKSHRVEFDAVRKGTDLLLTMACCFCPHSWLCRLTWLKGGPAPVPREWKILRVEVEDYWNNICSDTFHFCQSLTLSMIGGNKKSLAGRQTVRHAEAMASTGAMQEAYTGYDNSSCSQVIPWFPSFLVQSRIYCTSFLVGSLSLIKKPVSNVNSIGRTHKNI